MKKIINKYPGFELIGIGPGQFVRLHQGLTPKNPREISECHEASSGEMCFQVYQDRPECFWGSGVYVVTNELDLLELETDWDSSD